MTAAKKTAAKKTAPPPVEQTPEQAEAAKLAGTATDVTEDTFNPEVTSEINELEEGTSYEYKGFLDGKNVAIGTSPTRDGAEVALEAELTAQIAAHKEDWVRAREPRDI